jgi:hypothetical protein
MPPTIGFLNTLYIPMDKTPLYLTSCIPWDKIPEYWDIRTLCEILGRKHLCTYPAQFWWTNDPYYWFLDTPKHPYGQNTLVLDKLHSMEQNTRIVWFYITLCNSCRQNTLLLDNLHSMEQNNPIVVRCDSLRDPWYETALYISISILIDKWTFTVGCQKLVASDIPSYKF